MGALVFPKWDCYDNVARTVEIERGGPGEWYALVEAVNESLTLRAGTEEAAIYVATRYCRTGTTAHPPAAETPGSNKEV